jgi:hypothetical protein
MKAAWALGAAASAGLLMVLSCGPRATEVEIDPVGPNAGCYVCHMTFVREELSRTHLKAKVPCVRCHGISAAHANDEDIGATKPDITYRRGQVNSSCRTCHKTHDVAPERVVALWQERLAGKPATQPSARSAVCTDCHGSHRIARASRQGLGAAAP